MNNVKSLELFEIRTSKAKAGLVSLDSYTKVNSIKRITNSLIKTKEIYVLDNDVKITVVNNLRKHSQSYILITINFGDKCGYQYMLHRSSIDSTRVTKEDTIYIGNVDKNDDITVKSNDISINIGCDVDFIFHDVLKQRICISGYKVGIDNDRELVK